MRNERVLALSHIASSELGIDYPIARANLGFKTEGAHVTNPAGAANKAAEFNREEATEVASRDVSTDGTIIKRETLYKYSPPSHEHCRLWFVWTDPLSKDDVSRSKDDVSRSLGQWKTEDEAKQWLKNHGSDRLEEHFPSSNRLSKLLKIARRSIGTLLGNPALRVLFVIGIELAPILAAAGLVYLGWEITKIWSLKSPEERRLESTSYLFAFEDQMSSETVVGFARGMNFVADCPLVGVMSQLTSYNDGNAARLALKVIMQMGPIGAEADSDQSSSESECKTLLIGLSGRLRNEGHQIADGALSEPFYYKNPNNEHEWDTVFMLDLSKQQDIDDSINVPSGWREVALLEMNVTSPYVYFGPYGEHFSSVLPFSRALEVLVSTYSKNLINRVSAVGSMESYGLAAFFFHYVGAPDMRIVSLSEDSVNKEAKTLFRQDDCFCFGYDSLSTSSGPLLRGWLLERPVDFENRQMFAVTIGAAIIGLGLAFGVESLFVWLGRLRSKVRTRSE